MSSDDYRPWICARCARFLTRPSVDTTPHHDCPVTGGPVALVEYANSMQAEQLRRQLEAGLKR